MRLTCLFVAMALTGCGNGGLREGDSIEPGGASQTPSLVQQSVFGGVQVLHGHGNLASGHQTPKGAVFVVPTDWPINSDPHAWTGSRSASSGELRLIGIGPGDLESIDDWQLPAIDSLYVVSARPGTLAALTALRPSGIRATSLHIEFCSVTPIEVAEACLALCATPEIHFYQATLANDPPGSPAKPPAAPKASLISLVSMRGCPGSGDAIAAVLTLCRPGRIEFSGGNFDRRDCEAIAAAPGVGNVSFRGTKCGAWEPFANWPIDGASVEIHGTEGDRLPCVFLTRRLSRLSVTATWTPFDAASRDALDALAADPSQRMDTLALQRSDLSTNDLIRVIGAHRPTELTIAGPCGDAGAILDAIRGIGCVTVLALVDAGLTNDHVRAIADLASVRRVNVALNEDIDDPVAVAMLLAVPSIEHANLVATGVAWKDVMPLLKPRATPLEFWPPLGEISEAKLPAGYRVLHTVCTAPPILED